MPMNMNSNQAFSFSEIRNKWLNEMLPLNGYTPSNLIQPLGLPPTSKLENAKLLADRKEIIALMPKNSKVCEVGTQEGIFAEYILETANPSEMHLLDIDLSPLTSRNSLPLTDSRVKLHEGDSSSLLKNFPNEYFDWIYIDGDHSYEGALKDAMAAVKKIPVNGYLLFNDFTIWSPVECIDYGVPYVVCEILRNYPFVVSHFAFHPLGYHDIALKKVESI